MVYWATRDIARQVEMAACMPSDLPTIYTAMNNVQYESNRVQMFYSYWNPRKMNRVEAFVRQYNFNAVRMSIEMPTGLSVCQRRVACHK